MTERKDKVIAPLVQNLAERSADEGGPLQDQRGRDKRKETDNGDFRDAVNVEDVQLEVGPGLRVRGWWLRGRGRRAVKGPEAKLGRRRERLASKDEPPHGRSGGEYALVGEEASH